MSKSRLNNKKESKIKLIQFNKCTGDKKEKSDKQMNEKMKQKVNNENNKRELTKHIERGIKKFKKNQEETKSKEEFDTCIKKGENNLNNNEGEMKNSRGHKSNEVKEMGKNKTYGGNTINYKREKVMKIERINYGGNDNCGHTVNDYEHTEQGPKERVESNEHVIREQKERLDKLLLKHRRIFEKPSNKLSPSIPSISYTPVQTVEIN